MVVHPSPPADVPSLIEAYREVLGGFVDTCDGLREAEWDLPIACAGWTARDHLAHVVHVEDQLTGSEHPLTGWADGPGREQAPIEVGSPEHVRHDFGVWVEEGLNLSSAKPTRVEAFSTPYFELVRKHSALKQILQLGSSVLLKLDGKVYRFEPAPKKK